MTNIHVLITINWFKIGMTKLSKILCTNLYLDCTRMRCFVGRNFSAVSHPKVMIYNADRFSIVGWSSEIRYKKVITEAMGLSKCTVGWSLAVAVKKYSAHHTKLRKHSVDWLKCGWSLVELSDIFKWNTDMICIKSSQATMHKYHLNWALLCMSFKQMDTVWKLATKEPSSY